MDEHVDEILKSLSATAADDQAAAAYAGIAHQLAAYYRVLVGDGVGEEVAIALVLDLSAALWRRAMWPGQPPC